MPDMTESPKHARLTALGGLVRENPVLPVIAIIGFSVSFQTITALARAQHMPGSPYLYPVLIDVFFLGLVVEARKAIDDGRSDLVPRAMAWVLAGFTVYVNAHGSPARDWLGITLHVAAPVAWITFLELTRWRKLRKVRAGRPDAIPRARWLLSPLRTAGMRRRMVLHNVTSYAEAVAREEARLLAMDLASDTFGKRWKRDAPRLLVHHLTQGTLPAAVSSACSARSADLAEKVESWVTGAKTQRDRVRQRTVQPDAAPGPVKAPPQPARKAPPSDAQARRAKVRDLLAAGTLTQPEVAKAAGVSLSTVERIRREIREMPRQLHPVREA